MSIFSKDKFKVSDVVDTGLPTDPDEGGVRDDTPEDPSLPAESAEAEYSVGDVDQEMGNNKTPVEMPGKDGRLNEEGVFEQNDDRGPFISTYSGALFFVNEMNVKDIPILDIANALSLNCRFNGHIDRFYSVAEHCVLVSNLVSEENALYGLLHDYAEAFVSDVPRPFKASITGHDTFEAAVMANVCELYGLPLELPDDVAYIDRHICAAEATVLAKSVPDWVQYYDISVVPPHDIKGLQPRQARAAFMTRFNDLTIDLL